MEQEKLLNRNISLYYLYKFLRQLHLFLPIYTLFYIQNNLSMSQVLLVSTSMVVFMQLLQIPTGIFADLYGRKISVIIGGLFNFLSILIWSLSTNFYHFLLGGILMGIGLSFVSGAFQAIIYDSLFEMNKVKEFLKLEGRSFFFHALALTIASFLGGFLAEKSLRLTYFVTLIPSLLAVIVVFMLYEPKHHHRKEEDFFLHYKEAYDYSINHKKIVGLIFYFGINLTFIFIIFNFSQIYFMNFGISKTILGMLYALFILFAAISAVYAHNIESFLGEKNSLILSPFLILMGFSLIVFTKNIVFAIIAIILIEFVWGFINPLVASYLNDVLHSKYRATILSFAGFVFGGLSLILGPVFGYINDHYSLMLVFQILAGLSIISLLLSVYIIHGNGNNTSSSEK